MANNFSSPGIQINEIDRTQSLATQSNRKIGVVVVAADQGVTNEIVYCEDETDLVKYFGKPNNNNYEAWFSAKTLTEYGVLAAVIRPSASTTGLRTANVTTSGFDTALTISGVADYDLNQNNYIFSAQTPTDLYNGVSIIAIDHGADQILTISTAGGTFVTPVVGDIVKTTTSNGWVYSTTATTCTVVLNDTKKKMAIGDTLYAEDGIAAIGNITASVDFYSTQYIAPNVPWSSIAPQPGTSVQGATRGAKYDEFHIVLIDTTGKITGAIGNIIESFTYVNKAVDGVSSEGVDTYWKRVIKNKSVNIFPGVQAFNIGNTVTPVVPVSSAYVTADLGSPSTNGLFKLFKNSAGGGAIRQTLAGGKTYDWTTPAVIDEAINSAYDIVSDAQIFGDVDFLIPGKISTTRVNKLVSICDRRRDCRVAVSPRYADVVNNSTSTKKVANIIEFFDTLPSSSFMIFGDNYKFIFDKYNNVNRYIPCAADIAGLTLSTTHSWQSPAGLTHGVIKNSIKLAYSAKKSERDQLYTHRINPIYSYPGKGTILYGDKTALSSPSAFDRINVRGLVIEIQKIISQFAENILFEINDETTRSNFLSVITPYLQNILINRGVYEYKIVCDGTNNTPINIDAGQFQADIYIKPSRSVNFITLNFITTNTGATFTDSIA
jgi:Phage tail sheath protein subtilisin-like domain/Phage tail sheath C-terminal domain